MRPDARRAFTGRIHGSSPPPGSAPNGRFGWDIGASQLHQRAIVSVCNVPKTDRFALAQTGGRQKERGLASESSTLYASVYDLVLTIRSRKSRRSLARRVNNWFVISADDEVFAVESVTGDNSPYSVTIRRLVCSIFVTRARKIVDGVRTQLPLPSVPRDAAWERPALLPSPLADTARV